MCMERRTQLIESTVQSGAWREIGERRGPKLSNLAFAYDLILFSEASVDQQKIVMACLD